MKTENQFFHLDETILRRHERGVQGKDIDKLGRKEGAHVLRERMKMEVKRALELKEKQGIILNLTRVLHKFIEKKRPIEEKHANNAIIVARIKSIAQLKASKIDTKGVNIDSLTEEQYYILINLLSIKIQGSKGKIKKRLQNAMSDGLNKMKKKRISYGIMRDTGAPPCDSRRKKKSL